MKDFTVDSNIDRLLFLVKEKEGYSYVTAKVFFRREDRKLKIKKIYERSKQLV